MLIVMNAQWGWTFTKWMWFEMKKTLTSLENIKGHISFEIVKQLLCYIAKNLVFLISTSRKWRIKLPLHYENKHFQAYNIQISYIHFHGCIWGMLCKKFSVFLFTPHLMVLEGIFQAKKETKRMFFICLKKVQYFYAWTYLR